MESMQNRRTIGVERIVWWSVQISLLAGIYYMYTQDNGTKVFMGFLTIAVMLAIALVQRRFNYPLPSTLASIVYLFIFFSVVIGTFGGGYKIKHFDDFLHVFSGIWIGYASWVILRRVLHNGGAANLPNSFIALYIISFSLAAGAVWELLEFAGDKLFSFTAQGRDPDDTMIDMIMGSIGGVITAFAILKLRGKDKSEETDEEE
ncbi:hypothetical protein [Planococcus sp. ISL-109]|uniref:hypothetical protein n=1 Tax=Planococcus sp. ISL-109 TaxID=2819166 RepID=UPI001BE72489|nr:hypothetical protein [Planococcus sp. ISL-109]MBT2582855.1 hypothetical protein [Planococcus sp. ISL-109]